MKSMNYSLIRTICALVIGLVLVLWPDAAINYIVTVSYTHLTLPTN